MKINKLYADTKSLCSNFIERYNQLLQLSNVWAHIVLVLVY